ncbi:alanine racemase [Spongiibacter taiwanensis]|uniref:alanine racemase n=1 Tax=Spongiibacter taiwanensis TaxID=1748242 RepID=UPI002035ECF7|nr:alanine racemase [Spongiibacter taiwanensis]USA43477.1 alanine racemase [Spongiibacter taiwanensis]
MHNTTWVEFSAAALLNNVAVVRKLAPEAAILAMVKGNGYGHGAGWVTETLAGEVDGFAVARMAEAQTLRKTYPKGRLVLLGTLLDEQGLQDCADLALDVVVHDLQTAQLITEAALPRPICVWLKLNVGMNRLGMTPADFARAHNLLRHANQVSAIHHMSHFSEADDLLSVETGAQIQRLIGRSQSLDSVPKSMSNSAGIIAHRDAHSDWIRPGIMLYGDDPTTSLPPNTLQPVMTFKARILSIRTVRDGAGVGYNRRWRAFGERQIATVAAGYADGYPRQARDGTPVLVNGQRAKIAGRVSMDLATIDITHLKDIKVGDPVTLWGEGLPASEVGEHCSTISYELFTRITDRVARIYD